MAVAAPPKCGHYFTDGKRLIEIVWLDGDCVEAEDVVTYHIERISFEVFYRDWRKVKKMKQK